MSKKRKTNVHMEAPSVDGVRRTVCGRQVAITTRDAREVNCPRCVIALNVKHVKSKDELPRV